MTPEQIRSLYDSRYAAEYDAKFLHADVARPDTEYETKTLGDLLKNAGSWLDVACGTGYYLSLFPHVERAGLDLSPAMLEVAASRNPGVALHEGNFLDPRPEWRDRWGLVSCMWFAYGLVSSMAEVERLVANLASWTAPDGVCFMPVCDPTGLAGVTIPYDVSGIYPGRVVVTGITWSYYEEPDSKHENMVAPHIPYMLSMFRAHFEEVELIDYPGNRQAIVARRKRNVDASPARSAATGWIRSLLTRKK